MNHSINEWQDLSLKKDIEKISHLLHKKTKYEKPVVIEILITILTLLLDKVFDLFGQYEQIKRIVFALLFIVAITTLLCLLTSIVRDYLVTKLAIKKSAVTIKPFVDIFDNGVCYYAMTASNFYEGLLQISIDLTSRDDQELKEKENFYFIETNYYINKSISELNKLQNVISNVFTNDAKDVICRSKIHISRLQNIVELLFNIRKELNKMSSTISYSETLVISDKYDDLMRSILAKVNDQGIISDKLVWIE